MANGTILFHFRAIKKVIQSQYEGLHYINRYWYCDFVYFSLQLESLINFLLGLEQDSLQMRIPPPHQKKKECVVIVFRKHTLEINNGISSNNFLSSVTIYLSDLIS